MKIAIIGSRYLHDLRFLNKAIDKSPFKDKITMVISGGASGVDYLAERWCKYNKIPIIIYKPDWDKYGKSAGPIRNQYIIENSDGVIAIPHPTKESKGTNNSIKIAKEKDKPLFIYNVNNDFILSIIKNL